MVVAVLAMSFLRCPNTVISYPSSASRDADLLHTKHLNYSRPVFLTRLVSAPVLPLWKEWPFSLICRSVKWRGWECSSCCSSEWSPCHLCMALRWVLQLQRKVRLRPTSTLQLEPFPWVEIKESIRLPKAQGHAVQTQSSFILLISYSWLAETQSWWKQT